MTASSRNGRRPFCAASSPPPCRSPCRSRPRCCCAPAAGATTIERVVSPGGIEAWLVQEPTVPLVAIDFAFRGGASQDPADKPGVANMATSLIDEGAGDLDSKAFHERLEAKAIELSFSATRDQSSRLAAHAVRPSGRGVRPAAARAHRAALRYGRRRAHPRADHVGAAPRDHEPERDRDPALVGDRVSRAIPTAGRSAARSNRSRPSRRPISRAMSGACSRATPSRSASSATSIPPRPAGWSTRCSAACRRRRTLTAGRQDEPQGLGQKISSISTFRSRC